MSTKSRKVYVIGVGLTKFERPGTRNWDYPDMGAEAILKALEDSGISYKEIDQVACGYVYVSTIFVLLSQMFISTREILHVDRERFTKWE